LSTDFTSAALTPVVSHPPPGSPPPPMQPASPAVAAVSINICALRMRLSFGELYGVRRPAPAGPPAAGGRHCRETPPPAPMFPGGPPHPHDAIHREPAPPRRPRGPPRRRGGWLRRATPDARAGALLRTRNRLPRRAGPRDGLSGR